MIRIVLFWDHIRRYWRTFSIYWGDCCIFILKWSCIHALLRCKYIHRGRSGISYTSSWSKADSLGTLCSSHHRSMGTQQDNLGFRGFVPYYCHTLVSIDCMDSLRIRDLGFPGWSGMCWEGPGPDNRACWYQTLSGFHTFGIHCHHSYNIRPQGRRGRWSHHSRAYLQDIPLIHFVPLIHPSSHKSSWYHCHWWASFRWKG